MVNTDEDGKINALLSLRYQHQVLQVVCLAVYQSDLGK